MANALVQLRTFFCTHKSLAPRLYFGVAADLEFEVQLCDLEV